MGVGSGRGERRASRRTTGAKVCRSTSVQDLGWKARLSARSLGETHRGREIPGQGRFRGLAHEGPGGGGAAQGRARVEDVERQGVRVAPVLRRRRMQPL